MNRLPPVAPPDQRYWRRRANRRVRKARVMRKAGRWGAVLALQVIVAAVTAAAVALGCHGLLDTEAFHLSRIEVEGVHWASSAGIRARLTPELGTPLFGVSLEALKQRVREDPWVIDCEVKRVLPDSLHVHVVERQPRAVALIDGEPVVVDGRGEPIVAAGTLALDLPLLSGLTDERQNAQLRRGVTALLQLRDRVPALHDELSELELARGDRIVARTLSPGPDLLLDPGRVERNVATYLDMKDEIERRYGALAHVDLRWRGRIAYVPVEKDEVR